MRTIKGLINPTKKVYIIMRAKEMRFRFMSDAAREGITFSDGVLTAFVQGEIDHHSAVGIRTEIDRRIQKDKPDILRLDYSGVTFMDSSGIGLIMGRYKLISAFSGKLEVVNVPLNMARVVRLSGIEKLGRITIKES